MDETGVHHIEVDDTEVSYDQILPKALVHKDGFDDVFLTSFTARTDTESVLGAELPRSHDFYCELPVSNPVHDLAVLIEVCRQACFVVAHEQFDVPLGGKQDAKFLMRELSARFGDTGPFDTDEPVDVVVHCQVADTTERAGKVSGLVWAFTMQVGDVVVGQARMAQSLMPRSIWGELRNRLREGRGLPSKMEDVDPPKPSRLDPAAVGRQNPDNVVLTAVGETDDGLYRATLRADLRHPVMFDHPADYIFAMVQLEAARQLALVVGSDRLGVPATDLEMHAVAAEYHAVAEYDLHTELRATVPDGAAEDDRHLRITIETIQQDRTVSSFDLSVRPLAVSQP